MLWVRSTSVIYQPLVAVLVSQDYQGVYQTNKCKTSVTKKNKMGSHVFHGLHTWTHRHNDWHQRNDQQRRPPISNAAALAETFSRELHNLEHTKVKKDIKYLQQNNYNMNCIKLFVNI